MKKARQLPVQLTLSVVAVLAMSTACTVDTNTARRKTGNTNNMNNGSADSGTNMNSPLDAGVIADAGNGMQTNCNDNPSMCVPHELVRNAHTWIIIAICLHAISSVSNHARIKRAIHIRPRIR